MYISKEEHAADRWCAYLTVMLTGLTTAGCSALSVSQETTSSQAATAGAIAGTVCYFGLKYGFQLAASIDKPLQEKRAMERQILHFGPKQGLHAFCCAAAGMMAMHNANLNEHYPDRHLVNTAVSADQPLNSQPR